MTTTSNVTEVAAGAAELPNCEATQVARNDLWGLEPDQAEVDLDEHSYFVSEPVLDIPTHCSMIWPASTKSQGTHHASFGDKGTTASVSRYGDMMQVTQCLEKGDSGVFSLDHETTHEPCLVAQRARDLEGLSETLYGNYTFGLFMDDWPSIDPKVVRWVNWRWPRYEWETENMRIMFQYYVHEGIVLHQLLFQNISSKKVMDPNANLNLSGKMRVQEVDYLSGNSQDVQQRGQDESQGLEHTGPCGYGRVECHPNRQVVAVIDVFVDGHRKKIPVKGLPSLGSLGIGCTREIVVAYRLSLLPHQRDFTWKDFMITAAEANVGKFLQDETKEMSIGCLDPGVLDLPLLGRTMPNTAQEDMTKQEKSEQSDQRTTDHELRMVHYLTARHLEHILSVCAVPFPNSQSKFMALTCGDMSGHRICTSASYYAFLFLIKSERRLAEVKELSGMTDNGAAHIDSLRDRIRKTCQGHIMWLENVWGKTNPAPFSSGHFTANYWVTGERQDHSKSHTSQPPDSVTDTAFQILKIKEYASTYKDGSFEPLLTKVFVAWLHDLDWLDPREKFAWPRPKQDGVDTFRLEDHFWVWKALKAMEDQDMWSKLPKPNRSNPNVGKRDTDDDKKQWETFKKRLGYQFTADKDLFSLYDQFFMITRRLVPREVQRGVLQRFTTVNDVSGVRALALNRSSRETRFLLHNRDSAMLYDPDGPDSFFPDESFNVLWQQTLKSQPYHPANEESTADSKWYTVMRYALSIMMGARGSTLNSMKASNALPSSFKTLLEFFNHNGFLGEQLSWLTKEPVVFDDDCDRDSHFHVSFEVLYVLLTHAKYAQPKPEPEGKKDLKEPIADTDRLSEVARALKDVPSALKTLSELLATTQRNRIPRSMENNVCSIQEEWLYNYPGFFSTSEGTIKPFPPSNDSNRSRDDNPFRDESAARDAKGLDAMIVDVKKQKQYGKSRKHNIVPQTDYNLKVLSYKDLAGKLGSPRRARDAKKRFVWLPNADHEATCASLTAHESEAERQAVSLFFNRHFQCEKHVQDDTSLTLNAWSSELHMSFQCLVDEDKDQDQAAELRQFCKCLREHNDNVYCVLSASSVIFPQSEDKKAKILRRACMSYRFNGDLFDHYWTCHFVESSPQTKRHERSGNSSYASPLSSPSSSCPSPSSPPPSHHDPTYTCSCPAKGSPAPVTCDPAKGSPAPVTCMCDPCLFLSEDGRQALFDILNKDKGGFKTWWQRKALEILLLQRMLAKIFQNTRSILNEIETILIPEEKEKHLDHWELQRTSTLWRQLADTLGTIEDDLTSILETLHVRDDMAKYHGGDKPRWTLNDENKYRGSIQKEQTLLESRRRDIQQQKQKATILQKRFKEAAHRVQTRFKEEEKAKSAAREHQSERNIRWFTYVTIVFAPLSFAEGFYSMGGAPPYELTRSLATFSALALAVTVVLLFGALKTFSALKEKRDRMESGRDHKSRKSSSALTDKGKSKGFSDGGKGLPSLWSLLLSTILDHLANAVMYPMRLWKDGPIPAKALPSLILGFALGVIISPVFISLWLIQFFLLNLRDLYLLFEKLLYIPTKERPEPRSDAEAGIRTDWPGHFTMRPPRLFESFLKEHQETK